MTQFTCHGPFEIPTVKLAAARSIAGPEIMAFWSQNASYSPRVGCYIFGMRAGKGITPWYVGKATKSFGQEAFSSDKLTRYLHVLADYQRGKPVIFFVAYPAGKKGTTNFRHIAALEKFLIQSAAIANPFLKNINHATAPNWGIAGVLRSATKKPTNSAVAVKALLGF